MIARIRLIAFCFGLLLSSGGYGSDVEPFSIVILPDTQHYSDSASRIQHFHNQTQWIVDNRAAENIVFVSHLGDIVENGGSTTEWGRADAAMDRLDAGAPDLPYGMVLGNHDTNPTSNPNASADLYVNTFGPSRYAGRSWYGGSGPDQRNHWQTFSAGERDFLHFSLEYQAASPTNADNADVVSWAQNVIDAHPGWPTIVSTHQYLLSEGTRSSHGTRIFNALVNQNPQVFLVVNGHTLGEAHRTVQNAAGHDVIEMLADYQGYPNGGDGWLRMLTFDVGAGEILASTYSPSLDQYETDANSQFVLSVDFDERFREPVLEGAVIASQDFEGNTVSRGIPRDDSAISQGWYDETNGYTKVGLGFDSGVGLGWTHSTDAIYPVGVAPVASSDNGDVIGVVVDNQKDFGTTNGLSGAPGQTGNFYLVEDADSTWTVAFDPVDASDYQDLELSFTWAIDNDGGGSTAGSNFEESDFIEVTVNGVSVFKVDGAGDYFLGDAVGGLDDLDAPYINAFTPEDIDISAFDGQILNINFVIANNTAPEDIAFDNLEVSGIFATALFGDANKDGQVTGADLISVQVNFGNVGSTPLPGDANNDSQVTGADLISVQQNFGNVANSGGVPEPATFVLMLSGLMLIWRHRLAAATQAKDKSSRSCNDHAAPREPPGTDAGFSKPVPNEICCCE